MKESKKKSKKKRQKERGRNREEERNESAMLRARGAPVVGRDGVGVLGGAPIGTGGGSNQVGEDGREWRKGRGKLNKTDEAFLKNGYKMRSIGNPNKQTKKPYPMG